MRLYAADALDAAVQQLPGTDLANALGCTGEDDIARMQRVEARCWLDQLGYPEDQIASVGRLARLAIHQQLKIQLAESGSSSGVTSQGPSIE